MNEKRIVVGISGASGTVYGTRLVEKLAALEWKVELLVTHSAWRVLQGEAGRAGIGPSTPLSEWLNVSATEAQRLLRIHNIRDIAAPMASGTFRAHAMIIMPCSMKTVAALAHGYSDNLMTRCADCFLKERRPLLVVPRETPLSLIHLRNLTLLAEAGALIVPAMPAFYHKPGTIADLVDFMVMKVLDLAGIEHGFGWEWKGPSTPGDFSG